MPGIAHGAQDKSPGTATWMPNKDEQADLDAIDTKLQRMRDHVTADPYVMTIPQDVEPRYHHHYEAQAKQWLYSAPFEEGEHEATQYLTFHYHEPGKEMYMLHSSRPMRGSSASQDKPRLSTGMSTPNTAPKKKISFSAYKKGKQNGEAATPERDPLKSADAPTKQPAVKGPVERVKAETQDMLAAVAEESEEVQKVQKERSPEQGDLKRKRVERSEVGKAGVNEPSLKKQKMESKVVKDHPARHQKDTAAISQSKMPDGNNLEESDLPPRLSPGMPPRLSPTLPDKLSPLHNAHAATDGQTELSEQLPARLSPTLPENITKALQARNSLRPSSQASNPPTPSTIFKDKNGKLTPMKKAEGITKHKSPVPRNGFRASSSSPAVRSEVDSKVAAASAPRAESPEHSQDDEIMVAKASNTKNVEKSEILEMPASIRKVKEAEDLDKSTLVVRLKYGRSRRENVLRILKMRSKPHKSMLLSNNTGEDSRASTKLVEKRNEERKDESAKPKGIAQKVGPVMKGKREVAEETTARKPDKTVPRQSEKRPVKPPENPTSPPKRKSEDDRQGPSTKRRKFEASDAHKEPCTPAPREMDSSMVPKSGQHSTPGTRSILLSQAMKRELSQDSNITHTPPAAANTPSVNGNVQTNGMTRPPSSQPSSKTHKQNAFEVEQKRYEDLGRQLKYSATAHLNHSQTGLDQKLAAVKAVESLLCYLLAFACADEANACADPKRAPVYRNWCGLNGFYAFVKRTSDAFAPINGLVCALGVVFNTRVLEISTLVPDPPKQETLIDTALLLTRAVAGLEEKLDIDTLQETFPRTWKERTKKLPREDKLEPTKLAGPYKLPIGVATSPVRAARAGHAMLREWMDREKVDYQLKLKL